MTKRTEIGLVAGLLALCAGGVVFVFAMLSRTGGVFEAKDDETPRAAARVEPQPAPARPPVPEPEPALPARAPTVIAHAPGMTDAGPMPVAAVPEPEEDEEVPPENAHEYAQLTLELVAPAEDRERVIRVTVRDRNGDAIQGALVVVRQGAAILYRERSDERGEAFFVPWAEENGPFRIDALAEGFAPATAPAVKPGVDTELIVHARPIVEGEVIAPSRGKGHVRLWLNNRELKTDIRPDGTFRFEDLDAGQVTLQAHVDPFGAVSDSFYLEEGTIAFRRLKVRAQNRARIFGEIRFWPRTGKAWINGIAVKVNPSGAYAFDDAVEGTNEIVVDAPGKALLRERFEVKALARSQVHFRLRPEAVIRGRVRSGRTNRPIRGAEVRVGMDYGDPRNERVPLFPIEKVPVVKTDDDGRFEVRRLDRGVVVLMSVVAPGYGQYLGSALPDGGLYTLLMPEGPFMFGKLRGLGGVPRDAVVTATPIDVDGTPDARRFNVEGWDHARTVRDRRGFYGLSGLVPGTYLVRVEAAGYGSVETVMDLHDARRTRVDLRLRRGEFATDADAELLKRLPPVIYRGAGGEEDAPEDQDPTVLRIDANRPPHEVPFPGLRVLFFEGDQEFAPPMEFVEGEFDLFGMPEANYRAVLTHPTLKKPLVKPDIVIRRGKPALLELR